MSGSIGHCGRPGCNRPTDDEIDRIAAATAHIPRLNRAMLALDAEDHFSDRHDPEALMGEYDDEATADDPWLCLCDFPDGDPHQPSAHDD